MDGVEEEDAKNGLFPPPPPPPNTDCSVNIIAISASAAKTIFRNINLACALESRIRLSRNRRVVLPDSDSCLR